MSEYIADLVWKRDKQALTNEILKIAEGTYFYKKCIEGQKEIVRIVNSDEYDDFVTLSLCGYFIIRFSKEQKPRFSIFTFNGYSKALQSYPLDYEGGFKKFVDDVDFLAQALQTLFSVDRKLKTYTFYYEIEQQVIKLLSEYDYKAYMENGNDAIYIPSINVRVILINDSYSNQVETRIGDPGFVEVYIKSQWTKTEITNEIKKVPRLIKQLELQNYYQDNTELFHLNAKYLKHIFKTEEEAYKELEKVISKDKVDAIKYQFTICQFPVEKKESKINEELYINFPGTNRLEYKYVKTEYGFLYCDKNNKLKFTGDLEQMQRHIIGYSVKRRD